MGDACDDDDDNDGVLDDNVSLWKSFWKSLVIIYVLWGYIQSLYFDSESTLISNMNASSDLQ